MKNKPDDMPLKKSLLDSLLGNLNDAESSTGKRDMLAEQLEPRILYSAAPVDAEVAPETEETPAAQEQAAPASDPVAEQSVSPGDAIETAAEIAAGEPSDLEVSLDQEVVLLTDSATEPAATPELTGDDLAPLVQESIERWTEAGASEEQLIALNQVTYQVADLGPGLLGMYENGHITIDDDAAGREWFVDLTPEVDEEFTSSSGSQLAAISGTDPDSQIDLLTVILHEQGHALGLNDLPDLDASSALMFGELGEGERRLATDGQADGAVAGSLEGQHFLTAVDDTITVDAVVATSVDEATGLLSNDSATGTLQPTAGADLFLDAGQDTDGDARWEDLSGGGSAVEFLLDDSPAVNRLEGTSSLQGITAAYDFQGGSTGNEAGALLVNAGGTTRSFTNATGDWTNESVTMELWFKPDNVTPTPSNGQILFEDGGGTGMGLYLDNSGQLQLRKAPNGGLVVYDIATDPSSLLLGTGATDEFIQATATYDVTSNVLELFVNGTSVGTDTAAGGDWSGSDPAALGTRGGGNAGGIGSGQQNTESFDGQLAIFRVYRDQILTAGEVQANFNSIAQPSLEVTEINGVAANLGSSVALTHGSVVVQSDGSLVYTPTSGSNGDSETFTYTVRDNTDLTTDTRNVTLNLVANTAPAPVDDTGSVAENGATVLVDVLANDVDPDTGDNSVLTITAFDAVSANGGIVTSDSGQLRYNPNGQFESLAPGTSTTDTFTYTVSDGILSTAATVTITINGENDNPVAVADSGTVAENGTISIDITGNDTDIDSPAQDLEVDSIGTISSGALVTINADGEGITYDPNGQYESLAVGETATDTFNVTINDSNGGTSTAQVSVTITGQNEIPGAGSNTASTDEATVLNAPDTVAIGTDI
ncbi:MAG: Ig-like domain-containing protein, partial [Verrucomicrobiota bacterium]